MSEQVVVPEEDEIQQPDETAADPFAQALDEAITEAAAEEGLAPEADAAPDGVADPVVPDAAATTPAPAGETPQAEDAPPTYYTFPSRYDDKGQRGQKAQPVTIEGLRWDAATRTITIEHDAAGERLQQLLQRGRIDEVSEPYRREMERQNRQLRQQVETRQQEMSAEAEQAAAFLEQLNSLMALPDDEQYLTAMLQLRQNMPQLRAEAKMKQAERMMQQARAAQQPPEPDVEQIVEEASQGAVAIARELLANQPWATDEVRDDLEAYLTDRHEMGRWVLRAERDLPEYGVRQGQYVANWDTLRELAERRVAPYRNAHDRITQTQRTAAETAKVAQQNAQVLGKPATPQKPATRPATTQATPTRQSRDEWKRELARKERDVMRDVFGAP